MKTNHVLELVTTTKDVKLNPLLKIPRKCNFSKDQKESVAVVSHTPIVC